MKRIEFIAPVESMRGNLSGTQKDLVYPTNDNRAYDAPKGVKSYARNYQPIFVGAKRASDGKKYFSVKTKTAVHITDKSQKALALLGGTAAIVAAIFRDKTGVPFMRCTEAFLYAKSKGEEHTNTLREYLTNKIKHALDMKRPACFVASINEQSRFAIQNPWSSIEYSGAVEITITDESLVKFWSQLANTPLVFMIEGMKGVAHSGDAFENVIASNYNVLDLSAQTVGGTSYVKMDSFYLQSRDPQDPEVEWMYVPANTEIVTDDEYRLVVDAPTA